VDDTIAAVASPPGQGAVSLLRVSGPGARAVAEKVFRGKCAVVDLPPREQAFGAVVDAEGEVIDQVLLSVFRGPASYTGEDVVEIGCHGGVLVTAAVLGAILAAGARPAEAGEFSKRAFLNGKIDLAQAEAVADLIHASSSMAHRVSLSHLQGRYSDGLGQLRDELLELCALAELEIDFSEEDVAFADRGRPGDLLAHAERLLADLLASYRVGELVRDGVRVVIGGRPNAGKSTLIRAVSAARPKVADYPFTALYPNLGVVSIAPHRSFVMADIPGLIEGAADGVGLGVRFLKHLRRTRVLLHLLDIAPLETGHDPVIDARSIVKELEAFSPELAVKERWLVLNKSDLMPETEANATRERIVRSLDWTGPVYLISAISGAGTQRLVGDLMSWLENLAGPPDEGGA